MVALPLIFATLYFGLGSQFGFHRKVAKWTFPIWMYVSVTGVLVFFVLRAYTSQPSSAALPQSASSWRCDPSCPSRSGIGSGLIRRDHRLPERRRILEWREDLRIDTDLVRIYERVRDREVVLAEIEAVFDHKK